MNQTYKSNLFGWILIFIGVFGGIFLSLLFSFLNMPLPVMLVVSQAFLLLVPTILYFIITKESIKKTLKLHWPGWLPVLLSFFIAIFIQPAMMFLSALSGLFFTNDVANLVDQLNSYPLIVMIGVVALTPAICEEITMRGILRSGYDQIDIKKAMLLNGLFFGMLHLNLQQFLYAFALGALFTYIVRITDSIIPAMVAHFTINGSQVLLQRLFTFIAELSSQDLSNLALEVSFYDKLITLGTVFIFALMITPIAGVLLYALRNICIDKNLIPGDFVEPIDQSYNQKVFHWPVWASIGLYIPFMAIMQFMEYLARS